MPPKGWTNMGQNATWSSGVLLKSAAVWVHRKRGWEKPNSQDQAKTRHATKRETQSAGSRHEIKPATESEERNTLASTAVAARQELTLHKNATADRNRKNIWQSGKSIQTWRNMSTLSGLRRKNCSVWSCSVCEMQVCPGCKRNANAECAESHKTIQRTAEHQHGGGCDVAGHKHVLTR